MKLFLFCVDALDYDFVEPRSFPNIKQEHYVKVEIPRRCMTIFEEFPSPWVEDKTAPFTPVIWETILTGKCNQKEPMPKPLKHSRDWNPHTIASHAKHPVIINSPLKADVKWQRLPLASECSFEKIAQSVYNVFSHVIHEVYSKLECRWDLFLVYTKLLDVVGHLYWQRDNVIERYYMLIEDFTRQLKLKLDDDTFLALISDHGMSALKGTNRFGGQHSHYAFASFSHNLPYEHLAITDLHDLFASIISDASCLALTK